MQSPIFSQIIPLLGAARSAFAGGYLREANRIYLRVLEKLVFLNEQKSAQYVECLLELAQVNEKQGDLATAEDLVQKAMSTAKSLFGSADSRTALVMRNLADICEARGKLLDANELNSESGIILTRAMRSRNNDKHLEGNS